MGSGEPLAVVWGAKPHSSALNNSALRFILPAHCCQLSSQLQLRLSKFDRVPDPIGVLSTRDLMCVNVADLCKSTFDFNATEIALTIIEHSPVPAIALLDTLTFLNVIGSHWSAPVCVTCTV